MVRSWGSSCRAREAARMSPHDSKRKFISLTWRVGSDSAFMQSLPRFLSSRVQLQSARLNQTKYSPPQGSEGKTRSPSLSPPGMPRLGEPLKATGAHHLEIQNRARLLGARAFLHVALGVAAVSVAYFFAAYLSLALISPSNGV